MIHQSARQTKNCNITKCEKLISMFSEFIFTTNFKKKLLLVKFWYSVKKHPQLSRRSTKILLLTHFGEVGFSLYTSIGTVSYNRSNV